MFIIKKFEYYNIIEYTIIWYNILLLWSAYLNTKNTLPSLKVNGPNILFKTHFLFTHAVEFGLIDFWQQPLELTSGNNSSRGKYFKIAWVALRPLSAVQVYLLFTWQQQTISPKSCQHKTYRLSFTHFHYGTV